MVGRINPKQKAQLFTTIKTKNTIKRFESNEIIIQTLFKAIYYKISIRKISVARSLM